MIIDSHCHLDFACFSDDLDALLKRCQAVGVSEFLVPSTTAASWSQVQALGQQYRCCKIALGLHPYFLESFTASALPLLEQQLSAQPVVALGEIGLDKWPGMPDYGLQIEVFCAQLAMADRLQLPVILHTRKSEDDVLKYLRQQGFKWGGIVHAFNGSLQQAKRFIEMGFVLGIGGTVTYPRANKARQVLQALADEEFVLETDAPDMPLSGYQGQTNTPERLPLVAQEVATLRSQSLEHVAEQTSKNLLRVMPNWHKV
ncbi:TatD family hydrolase [Marinomonas ostreistagni]|uniref:TatD family hydrolase n=1 Tax=Marinomonas ostreistagni TaxID=359209 RepID=UPI001950F632|nr:TatD family hydrolase [Marinomonas ostreistagni]MBM6551195.1 TatD family hydrolase [Marinomonas ostreistagni]